MIKKHKISFIVTALIIVSVIVCWNLYYLTFSRNGVGEEYKINWKSDKYDITFASLDEHFPYISNFYDGKILLDQKYIDVNVYVDDGEFSLGCNGISDFNPAVSGNFIYDGVSFVVSVNKVYDERFIFLNDKTIVFSKN